MTARELAFRRFADALGDYLDAIGWRALVVGDPRVQQQPGAAALNYEFVVRFTGGQKKEARELLEKKRPRLRGRIMPGRRPRG